MFRQTWANYRLIKYRFSAPNPPAGNQELPALSIPRPELQDPARGSGFVARIKSSGPTARTEQGVGASSSPMPRQQLLCGREKAGKAPWSQIPGEMTGREGREVLEEEDESVNAQESGAVLPGVSCEEGELLGEGIFTK